MFANIDAQFNSMWNEYIKIRRQGLKKQANKKLMGIVDYLQSLPPETQQAVVYRMCKMKFELEADIEIQYPLRCFMWPILEKSLQRQEMPQLRWLYQMGRYDSAIHVLCEQHFGGESPILDLLTLANETDKNDIKTVKLLLDFHLYKLWFGSHHFPDRTLISEEGAQEVLGHVLRLLDAYELDDSCYRQDYEYYRELYAHWFDYEQQERDIGFLQWCEEKGLYCEYDFPKVYYYERCTSDQ